MRRSPLQPSNEEWYYVIGITIVNAGKLLEADGEVRITMPETISAADLGPALGGVGR